MGKLKNEKYGWLALSKRDRGSVNNLFRNDYFWRKKIKTKFFFLKKPSFLKLELPLLDEKLKDWNK